MFLLLPIPSSTESAVVCIMLGTFPSVSLGHNEEALKSAAFTDGGEENLNRLRMAENMVLFNNLPL